MKLVEQYKECMEMKGAHTEKWYNHYVNLHAAGFKGMLLLLFDSPLYITHAEQQHSKFMNPRL